MSAAGCTSSQRLAAEALGTGLLVATVVGSGIMAEKLLAGKVAVALLGNTIPTAAILYVLITMFGPVSGAHFNPAVSLMFAQRRDLPWPSIGPYVAAQVIGGVLGTLLAHVMFDLSVFQVSATVRTGPAQWVSELVATFALVLTILGTIRAKPEAVPVAVALVITAAYWFTASTSFANPAVTVARAFSNTFAGIAPSDVPAFMIAQLLGGGLALITAERVFGWVRLVDEAATLAPADHAERLSV
jgi:glycerol uptake facilitator-like aquaporin